MYSVLIENQKTMDEFSKFQPLFMEMLKNNRIAVCKWIESGTTLDTAVPGLAELTNDKEEWRAVIVRFETDEDTPEFTADKCNPYDYDINRDNDGTVSESPVPLIRLTHMLGGLPAREQRFERRQISEPHKAPRIIYVPVENPEEEREYNELKSKYEFYGKRPSSILIVSVREGYLDEQTIDSAWHSYRESDSSEFWKRNMYPSICRFLVFDFLKQGPVQRDADEFNFWLSVLLLSINNTDSGVLQAYRLYTLTTEINRKKLADSFQDATDRLRSCRHMIEERIKTEALRNMGQGTELPRYHVQIPVSIRMPKDVECTVSKKNFHLFSNGVSTDNSIWASQRNNAETKLAESIRIAGRTLDKTADRMRDICYYNEAEVEGLNKYQTEDLTREVHELYHRILRIQGKLPNGDPASDEALSDSAENVKKFLSGRVVGQSALTAIVSAVLIIAAAVIPGALYFDSAQILPAAGILTAGIAAVSIIFAFVRLLFQKLKLNERINDYNAHLRSAFNRLTDNAAEYSAYMSSIASHKRAYSYMNLAERKRHYVESTDSMKYKHINAVNILLGKIRMWTRAYHLNVNFDSNHIDENTTVDLTVAPSESLLYTFETGMSYPIEINRSGVMMESPFSFVERLKITREEIYDE